MDRRGFIFASGLALCSGCTNVIEQSRGTVELENYSTNPVIFLIGVEPTKKEDRRQTPKFRNNYYVLPETSSELPEVLGNQEHRISVLIYGVDDNSKGNLLDDGQTTFNPEGSRLRLNVRYNFHGDNEVSFKISD